jgi:hypothetical protein
MLSDMLTETTVFRFVRPAMVYYDLSSSEIVVVGLLVNGRSASALKNRG